MIQVENLTKDFRNRKSKIYKRVVNGISFSVKKGEIVGYIGPNGAGKSTTIKMLSGILTPTEGFVKVNGLEPYKSRKKNARNIGVVFGQRTQLWWDLPLIDSFKILKRIYNIPENIYQDTLDFFDKIFTIKSLYNSTVRTLSLGERMKADIVASLLHRPKVLYLDEPTVGLDFLSKKQMRKAIKMINLEFETTVVITTHDMSDIEELCDRVIIINNGKLVYDGRLESLLSDINVSPKIEFLVSDERDLNTVKQHLSGYNLKIVYERNKVVVSDFNNDDNVYEIVANLLKVYPNNNLTIINNSIEDIISSIYASRIIN